MRHAALVSQAREVLVVVLRVCTYVVTEMYTFYAYEPAGVRRELIIEGSRCVAKGTADRFALTGTATTTTAVVAYIWSMNYVVNHQ